MGRRHRSKSHTLPSSPSSSSSSDFEFTISLSPHNKSSRPADELFYKGQLLPLHLSPRLSMLSNSSSTTASRDSTASRSSSDLLLDSDSSRPSSATDDLDFLKPPHPSSSTKSPKYFSLAKFSSVFRKDSAVKRASSTAREVLRKYFNKVKPLYEKLSHKQQQQQQQPQSQPPPPPPRSSDMINNNLSLSLRPRRRVQAI